MQEEEKEEEEFDIGRYESLADRGDVLTQKEHLTELEVDNYDSECEEYCITYQSDLNCRQIEYLRNINRYLKKKILRKSIIDKFGRIPAGEAATLYTQGDIVFLIDLENGYQNTNSILLGSPMGVPVGFKSLSSCSLLELEEFTRTEEFIR